MKIKRVPYAELDEVWLPRRYILKPKSPAHPVRTLDELAEINPRSRTFKEKAIDTDTVKLINISSVDRRSGRIVDPDEVAPHELPRRARFAVCKGDVLFPRQETKRMVPVLVEEDGMVASDLFAVLVPKVDPCYLAWALGRDYVKQQVEACYRGVSVRHITLEDIKALNIPWLDEERRRCKALEMKEKYNQLSKQKSTRDYKKEIDDVFCSLLGITQKKMEGMTIGPVDYARLKDESWLPDKKLHPLSAFDIRGVKMRDLKEVVSDIKTGINLSRKRSKRGQKMEVIKPTNVDVLAFKKPFAAETLEGSPDFSLETGDIVLPTRGRIGPAAVVTAEMEDVVFSNALVRIRCDMSKVLPMYFAAYLSSFPAEIQYSSYLERSTASYLSQKKLMRVKVPMIDLQQQEEIVQTIT